MISADLANSGVISGYGGDRSEFIVEVFGHVFVWCGYGVDTFSLELDGMMDVLVGDRGGEGGRDNSGWAASHAELICRYVRSTVCMYTIAISKPANIFIYIYK